uniref:Uncharacterized protein n=1 Tax=Leersia perrieri TaxID=77586 RepID=A0A0D9XSD4_9ORYZ
MHEFQLAGVGLLPRPMESDGISTTFHAKISCVPRVRIMVEPDSSWLIYRVYKKRQAALRVVIPHALGSLSVPEQML